MKSLKAKFRKNDVHEWNKNDERLLLAVEHGEVDKMAALLAKKGVSSVKLDGEGKAALHVAATRGLTECLSIFLAHGADLSVTDAAGSTALHLATKNNHVDCSRKLVQAKCPLDAVDSSGRTALHYAASRGSIDGVQLLCEHGSHVTLRDTEGFSPLLLSARQGHTETCGLLLDLGAEVNGTDNLGRTGLMLASQTSEASLVDLLVRRGADLRAVDLQGHDLLNYAQLSPSAETRAHLTTLLEDPCGADARSPKSPQNSDISAHCSPPSTPSAGNQEEVQEEASLKEQVEKLQEEKSFLLETIQDLKNTAGPVSTATVPAATVPTATVAGQVEQTVPGAEESLKERSSRPASMTSNTSSSFHSTQEEEEPEAADSSSSARPSVLEGQEEQGPAGAGVEQNTGGEGEGEGDGGEGGGQEEEIRLLRQALEGVQTKLLETRKENRSLHAQLSPGSRGGEEEARERERSREEDLLESLAELQAKLTETQERYHRALEEVQEMRAHGGGGGGGCDTVMTEKEELQRRSLEQEVQQLKSHLVQAGQEQQKASQRVTRLEEVLRTAQQEEQERRRKVLVEEERYKEAQEEIRMLQEALAAAVPVEEAARDFEEMKEELSQEVSGLQRRLLELSHAYSDARSQLAAAHKQLDSSSSSSPAPPPPSSTSSSSSSELQQQVQMLTSRGLELQAALDEAQKGRSHAQQEAGLLRQEAELQARRSVSLDDHSSVVSSLGNAIKELESQSEGLRAELTQKTTQVDALQTRLTAEKLRPDDSASRLHQEATRQSLEGEVSRLTQLLQGALRKQDELALETASAWQEVRESRAEREGLQVLLASHEAESRVLSSRLTEALDGVSQLKQLVEKHQTSERDKNKRIDDLSREVGKLRDALNSLSQLPYSASPATKRLQHNQQLETFQQQVKHLQYQLAESKKQHNDVVSVYRMHLLYAVQGQMDEDVQKALKQILMMCKMPTAT